MHRLVYLVSLALVTVAPPLHAGTVPDPINDFLTTYSSTGPRNPDLDIVLSSVSFDGTNFRFTTTVNGPIGSTPGPIAYAWGINRGGGAPLLAGALPGISFDTVAVMFANGGARIITSPDAKNDPDNFFVTFLPPGTSVVSGNTITALFPVALLPSTGFDPKDYTFTNWVRFFGVGDGDDSAEIADFSGGVGGLRAIPEPAVLSLLAFGAGLAIVTRPRRRARCDRPGPLAWALPPS